MTEPNPQDQRVPWPGDVDPDGPWGADAVLKHLASEGVARSTVSVDLLPGREKLNSPGAYDRWNMNASVVVYAHDLYLALTALRELDPAKADEVADRCTLAAVAGDSYGEWLWQWAEDEGLDAQAICDAARAELAP